VNRERDAVLTFAAGDLRAAVRTWGATLVRLDVPDRAGRRADVVLGFETQAAYAMSPAHLGGIIGRFANRIADARFTLDGATFRLTPNEGRHQLHGGAGGFDCRTWDGAALPDGSGVALSLRSPHGEEGYPGALDCRVEYRLRAPRELWLTYEARCDQPTPVSLTNHTYWNLAGPPGDPMLDHELEIAADRYLPVDAEHIPTGELRDVAGTPFDFRRPRKLGAALDLGHPELALHRGFDHPFELRAAGGERRFAARLRDPRSGRVLEIETTAPCVQLYGGQFLAEGAGKAGWRHRASAGVCLETQEFPDAPNQPAFPPAILRPGEVYRQETVYRFSAG
jgi:aldose 1-epimerase